MKRAINKRAKRRVGRPAAAVEHAVRLARRVPRHAKPRADVTAVVGAAYALHRLGRRSGATRAEARATLPGDELVADPMWQSTRAITINAAPEAVWPWIVQIGFPSHRAGWYTPHWLDRLTFGIKAASADEIRADLQKLERGDRVPDSDDWSVFFTVAEVDAPHALVLHSTRHVIKPIKTIDFSWAFVLRPVTGGRTRLFIRARSDYTPHWALPFVELVIGFGDFVNAGAMLRGIKKRVEAAGAGIEQALAKRCGDDVVDSVPAAAARSHPGRTAMQNATTRGYQRHA